MTKILIVFLVASLIGCSKTDKQQNNKSRPPLLVKSLILEPKTLEHTINATGTLLANEVVELRSEASGRIVSINFHEGQKVHKGAVLIKINDSELAAQLKKNELQTELALADEARSKMLLNEKGISQQEYDIALNKLQVLKAEAEYIKAQIEKTTVTAPFSGTIGLRQISVGAYVSSTTPLATLIQTETIKIEFSVPEQFAGYVKRGTKINFMNNREKHYEAIVYATDQQIDVNTRSLKVMAKYNNANNELTAGSFVKVEIILEKIENTLLVPSETVVPVLAGQIVYLYNMGRAKAVTVNSGIRTNSEVQILKGIKPGDTLITTGIMMLRDGATVKLQ